MSYQVIARKYRPQRFADVVGQDHVTQTLANAIRQNRIAHAYLFCGPRGTGKTTLARIFAKCLNCTGGPKVDFDDADPRCQEIAEGRSIDVLEIDGASNNGVEQVRELRETCKYAPASSRFKIYIIDEVHMLSTAAFNALLKTLEEPPAHVKFMFATTDPEKVLLTILSRCQRFDLRRIPAALIVKHLAQIARQEGVQIDESALFAIARGADGGMRDAESTLDQLISFCGAKIEEPDVLSMFGLTAQAQVFALARAILNAEPETVLRELDGLARGGKDLGRLLADLLGHFRNLLLFQVTSGDLRILEASEQEVAVLKEVSTLVPNESVSRIMEVLTESESRLRDAASRRIVVELALLRATQARRQTSLDTVLRQLQQLRGEGGATGAQTAAPSGGTDLTRPAAAPSPSPRPAATQPGADPATSPARVAGSAPVEVPASPASGPPGNLVSLWREILDAVGRASPFTRSYLLEAHPVSLASGVFTIGFDPEFAEHIGLVDNTKNHALLQTKLQELGHPGIQIKFITADAPAGWDPGAFAAAPERAAPSATSDSAAVAARAGDNGAGAKAAAEPPPASGVPSDDFKNDPLIRKALEVFKGQIVNIRA
jgi:DNA polymerase-3 subunit gamma/tau